MKLLFALILIMQIHYAHAGEVDFSEFGHELDAVLEEPSAEPTAPQNDRRLEYLMELDRAQLQDSLSEREVDLLEEQVRETRRIRQQLEEDSLHKSIWGY